MGLNMKRKDKIAIASGLSLGIFAGACSVVRTIELQSLSSMENYVYDTASMLLWSSTEVFLTMATLQAKTHINSKTTPSLRVVAVWMEAEGQRRYTWALERACYRQLFAWAVIQRARKRYFGRVTPTTHGTMSQGQKIPTISRSLLRSVRGTIMYNYNRTNSTHQCLFGNTYLEQHLT